MQERNFDKMVELGEQQLFTKLDKIPLSVRNKFEGMSKEDQVALIKEYEQEMPKELHDKIQNFVTAERKKGVKIRTIKRRVKAKFKIVII